ncbi:c-type cytochrome [Sphingobacterium sp. HJSM2_6]|uniref:c-type cytochrome n=1 Tax=Sphingobacterium sp. HJSM2_6 TaxID=3366264 RepID=UPI003BE28DDB
MNFTIFLLFTLFSSSDTAAILESSAEFKVQKTNSTSGIKEPMQKKKKEHPGKTLFISSSCVNCHGIDQKGIGTNPPLLKLAKKYKPADIEGFIKNGKGGMPPNYELSDEEVELISLYLLDKSVPTKKKVGTVKK